MLIIILLYFDGAVATSTSSVVGAIVDAFRCPFAGGVGVGFSALSGWSCVLNVSSDFDALRDLSCCVLNVLSDLDAFKFLSSCFWNICSNYYKYITVHHITLTLCY